jgi:HEAT repeat protein
MVLSDTGRPARVREAAGTILRGMHDLVPDVLEETLRRWWREGDAVLRRHALLSMEGIRCPDIVFEVASDPTHPLQAEALGQMEWWFDLPEHEAVKVAGLSHPDAKVRAAAAYVLLWDEPVAAELPLIEATRDPVPEVVAESANTLEYYPSLRVVRRLHEMLGHANAKVREEAEDSFQSIRNEFLIRICGRKPGVSEHIRQWLRPAWDILAFSDEELRPDEDESTPARREEHRGAMPVADLLALLADPDASPRLLGDRLRSNCWLGYEEEERRRLRAVLVTHSDQLVRERAAWVCAAWGETSGLLELVRDQDFLVRKSAMHDLGQLPPTPGIDGLAWNHLHRHDVLGTHATETLATFVRHAARELAVRRLGLIAGDHGWREGLRTATLYHLTRLGAGEELAQLTGLLLEPPVVTWSLHIALLEAATKLRLPVPDVGHLRAVDNLHVQEAVARFDAAFVPA